MPTDNPFKMPEFPKDPPLNPKVGNPFAEASANEGDFADKLPDSEVKTEGSLATEQNQALKPDSDPPDDQKSDVESGTGLKKEDIVELKGEDKEGKEIRFSGDIKKFLHDVLVQYNNLESDIPVNHNYWQVKQLAGKDLDPINKK